MAQNLIESGRLIGVRPHRESSSARLRRSVAAVVMIVLLALGGMTQSRWWLLPLAAVHALPPRGRRLHTRVLMASQRRLRTGFQAQRIDGYPGREGLHRCRRCVSGPSPDGAPSDMGRGNNDMEAARRRSLVSVTARRKERAIATVALIVVLAVAFDGTSLRRPGLQTAAVVPKSGSAVIPP